MPACSSALRVPASCASSSGKTRGRSPVRWRCSWTTTATGCRSERWVMPPCTARVARFMRRCCAMVIPSTSWLRYSLRHAYPRDIPSSLRRACSNDAWRTMPSVIKSCNARGTSTSLPSVELTADLLRTFLEKPASSDLVSIYVHWYRRPPKCDGVRNGNVERPTTCDRSSSSSYATAPYLEHGRTRRSGSTWRPGGRW